MKLADFQRLCDRLNPHCRDAIEGAVHFCRDRAHFEVTIDHFLVKLLEDPTCDISLVARNCGIDTGEWSAELRMSLDSFRSGNTGGVHWTQDVIQLVERAWMIASVDFGSLNIRSGTVLLALLALRGESPEFYAAVGSERSQRFLDEIARHDPKMEFATLTEGSTEGKTDVSPKSTTSAKPGSAALGKYTINLNDRAREGHLDPAVGRDAEIRRTVDVLCRRRKNNAILVGEPGVGKTAIAEGLARRIVEGDVPDALKNTDIRSLDLGLLQAGAGVKGEFESRLKQIVDEINNAATPVILFIDEAHLLIGAGNQPGSGDAANLLKPALARGELRSIAATTWSEYKRYFEKDTALQDRFELIKIEEPDESLAVAMLRGTKRAYEEHHRVRILDSGVEAVVQLSNRYLTGRHLPRKAVDLLDTAASRVQLGLHGKPAVIEDLESRVRNLETERDAKQRDQEDLIADHRSRLSELDILIDEANEELHRYQQRWGIEKEAVEHYVTLREQDDCKHDDLQQAISRLRELQNEEPLIPLFVDETIAVRVIADWTGIPVGSMLEQEFNKLATLEDRLRVRVRGQDHALQTLADTIRINKAGLSNPSSPIGVFLLVGPSGTGKTETALALADVFFGGERFVTSINMSEFKEEHALSLLIGSPPGYVGYGEGGILTEAVRQRPYCVVLLDEVEKAKPEILELFYQIFDKGQCEDRTGRVIDFRNTIILMTSNLDSRRITELCSTGNRPHPKEIISEIHPTLRDHFKEALLARFRVIPYYPLEDSTLHDIAAMKLDQLGERLRNIHGVKFSADEQVIDYFVDACEVTELGARQLDHIIQNEILPNLAWETLQRAGSTTESRSVRLILDDSEKCVVVFDE